jgi:general secretion pathway protein H
MIRAPQRQTGFTLIEAVVTLTILSLALGVTLATWRSAGSEMRRVAGQLSGTIRASYDDAALTGQTYRLVFALGKPVIAVEAAEALLSFDEDMKPLARGAELAAEQNPLANLMSMGLNAAAAKSEDGKDAPAEPPTALQALLGLAQQIDPEQEQAFKPTEHKVELGEDVQLLDVWIQGMDSPAKEGEAYLYFFPNGYTQDAFIHLTNDDGAVFTVKVAALTGQTMVMPEYLEAPQ